jgi:hypothetical protein
MSNLGGYQTATKVMKALGGPKKATALVGSGLIFGGYAVLRGVEAGGKKAVRVSKNVFAKWNTPLPAQDEVFTVASDLDEVPGSGGLVLKVGDEYRVIERDGDATLIEVLGDPKNPYVVSAELLKAVSNFSPEPISKDS